MSEKREPKFKIGQIVVPEIVGNRDQMRGQILEILTSETVDRFQISYVCRFHEQGKGLYGNPIIMKEIELVDFFDERFKEKDSKKDDGN